MRIGLDAAVVRMESKGHSGVTWPLPHHTADSIHVVAAVVNGTGQLGPPVQ